MTESQNPTVSSCSVALTLEHTAAKPPLVQPGAPGSFIQLTSSTPTLTLVNPTSPADVEKVPQYQDDKNISWNKDMSVDPEAIKIVLEQSTVPKAVELDPKRFFDNTLIREVNRDYASKLFPREVR